MVGLASRSDNRELRVDSVSSRRSGLRQGIMAVMSWDDLEPGQDDLVREDGARKKIKRAVRNVKPGLSDQEALYTDHSAGDPHHFTPNAERAPRSGQRRVGGRGQGPVKEGMFVRVRHGWSSLREAWNEAYHEAQMRQ